MNDPGILRICDLGSKADQRVARLLSKVQDGSLLALSDAASLVGMSEMTVRRDIAVSQGRLAILGGHVIGIGETDRPYALDHEQDTHRAAKIAACERALALIEPNDTIFIDSGTTTIHLASRLPANLNLTVVCFAMNVAKVLARMPSIRWILTGGEFQNATTSFAGAHGPSMLRDVRLNKAFVSAGGVHSKLGVSCANFSEVGMKRAAIDNAVSSILVVDSSKIDKVKPAFFANCAEFDFILSERGSIDIDPAQEGD